MVQNAKHMQLKQKFDTFNDIFRSQCQNFNSETLAKQERLWVREWRGYDSITTEMLTCRVRLPPKFIIPDPDLLVYNHNNINVNGRLQKS